MAINFIKKEDLSHITRTTRQWETTIDRYEIIPKGVLCIELCNDKLTKIKIGNGHLIYEQLPYVSDVNLSDYYTKEETNNLIKDLKAIKIKGEASSLSDLPLHGNEEGDLWFIPKQDPDTHSRYDEYIWYKNKWESFGSSDIDLSEYAKKSYVDTHIQEVQNEITEIIESGYLHKHDNKNILDHTSAVYNVEKDNKLRDLHNYDDTELREKAHTHLNKNILDQTDAVYDRDKDDKLSSLHNYDDTDVKDRISTLEGVAHSHSNQDVLDRTTAAFTKEQALTLLDCKDFEGTDGVHAGRHGFVPAPTAADAGKVLGSNGQWVENGSGGGGDVVAEGGGISITTDAQTGNKVISVNAGTGLEIDQQTGELNVTATGGDSIAEGNGIDITTDPQTDVKTISVDIGNGLQFNQNSEIEVNTGEGLSIDQSGEIKVNTSDGLSINQDNELEVSLGNGLQFDQNGDIEAPVMGASGVNHSSGLVPDPGANAGTSKYLNEDGTWKKPTADNYLAGKGIVITPNEWSESNFDVGDFIDSIYDAYNGWVYKSTDSFTIESAPYFGAYTRAVGGSNDGSYQLTLEPNTTYRLSWDTTNPSISYATVYETSDTASRVEHTIANTGDTFLEFTTASDHRFIKTKFGISDSSSSATFSNIHMDKGVPVSANEKNISVNNGDGLIVNSDNELEVNVGDGLSINASDELELDKATTSAIGGVIVGDNIDVNNGTISVPKAASNKLGVVKPSDGLSVDSNGVLTVDTGDGLSIDSTTKEVNVNVGDGLSINQDNELEVNVGDGLSVDSTNNDINVNTGRALSINSSTKAVDVDIASNSSYGCVKIGEGIDIDQYGIISVDKMSPFRAGNGLELVDESVRLPSAYARVEYVENTVGGGWALINSLVPRDVGTSSDKSHIIARLSKTAYSSSSTITYAFGRWDNYNARVKFAFGYHGTSLPLTVGYVYGRDASWNNADVNGGRATNYELNDIIDVDLSAAGLKIDNELIHTVSYEGPGSIGLKFGVFRPNTSGTPESGGVADFRGRIYSLKLYDDQVLIFNLVPCVQKSSSIVGFYDSVGDTFYPSVGDNPFETDMSTMDIDVADWVMNVTPATTNTIGGIKVGSGLSATNDGTLSVNAGDGLTIDTNNNLKAKIGVGLHFNENNAIEADEIDIDTYEPGNGISFIRHYARDLPAGYTQLEYIESRFDAGFILDYYPQKTSRIVCEAAYVDINRSSPSDNCLFGSRNGNVSSSKQFVFWFNNKTSDPYYVGFVYTGDTWSSVGEHYTYAAMHQRLLFEISPSIGVYCNNVLIQNPLSHPDRDPSPYKLGILCLATSDTGIDTTRNYQSGRIFTFKIYESDTLVVDLVPCLNDSDVPGLYDMVGEVFYPSTSGTDFTYDPDTVVTHDSITIDANRGSGIIYDNNALSLNPGAGLSIDATDNQKLNVNLADGLSIKNTSTNAIKINTGDGLSIDSTTNKLNVNIGDGLVKNSSNNIDINNNTDFYINTYNQLCINPLYAPTYEAGNGVQFVSTSPYNLPPNYTKLSCVESKNTSSDKSAFRLNYVPTTETKFDVLFGITKASFSDVTIIGSGGSNTAKYSLNITRSSAATNNTTVRFNYCQDNSSTSISFTTAIGDILHIVADKNGVYVNNNLVQTPVQTGSPSSYKLCVGSSPATNTAASFRDPSTPGKYYDIKIYEGNTLTVHLIPCLNDSNVPGMYDEVNELFHHNEWKTDFHYDENEKTRPGYYVQAKLGNGLQFDANNAIEVNTGDGLTVNQDNELEVSLGNGLQFDQNGAIEVVTEATDYVGHEGIDISSTLSTLYTELEYIEATGTQYIETDIIVDFTMRTEMDLRFGSTLKSTLDGLVPFGVQIHGSWYIGAFEYGTGNYEYFSYYDGYQWESGMSQDHVIQDVSYDTRSTVIINRDTCAYGDKSCTLTIPVSQQNPVVPVTVFGVRYAMRSQPFTARDMYLYGIKIYDANNNLIHELVPVKRNADNVLGLYDTKDHVFYTNDGENSFIAGNVIGPLQLNERLVSVNIGRALSINNDNEIDVDIATATSLGVVKAGSGLNIDEFGNLSTQATPFRIGRALSLDDESVRLPSAYYKAKYVESNGSANTTIPFNPSSYPNAKCVVKASVESAEDGYRHLFGTERQNTWTGAYSLCLYYLDTDTTMYTRFNYATDADNNVYAAYALSYGLGDIIDIECSRAGGLKINNEVIQTTSASWDSLSSYELAIFGLNVGNGVRSGVKGRIYSFKVYNGDTLIHNLVPAVRKSDNVVGFYNTSNNTFYSSIQSTEFTTDMDDLDVDDPDWVLNASIATSNSLGVVKPSTGLLVNEHGALTLDKASATTLGGVKVGNNLSIDSNGVLTANIINYSSGHAIEITGDLSIDKFRWEITKNAGDSMVAFRYFEYSDSSHIPFTIQSGTIEWSDGSTVSYPSGYDETFAGMMENRTKCTVTGWTGTKTLIMTFRLSQSIMLSEIAYFRWKTDDYMSGRQPQEFNIYAHDSINDEWILLKEVTDHSLVPSSGNTWSDYIDIEPDIGPGAINVKYGNGLTLNQNNELEVPVASSSTLGIVKIGHGVEIDPYGAIYVDAMVPFAAGVGLELIPGSSSVDALPEGYGKVDYIESNGSAYTIINYVPNRNTKVVGTAMLKASNRDPVVFGCRKGGGNGKQFVLWFNRYSSNRAKVGFVYGTNTWETSTDANGGRLIPYMTGDQFSFLISVDDDCNINNTFVHNITNNGAPATDLNLGIFALAVTNSSIESDDTIFKGRIYDFKIYENDELVVNLVPAVRLSDEKVGFYDNINDAFYPSLSSSNQFTTDMDSMVIDYQDTTLNTRLGTGLKYSIDNNIETNISSGQGIDISVDNQNGLLVSTKLDRGLKFNLDDEIEIDTGDGLQFDTNNKLTLDLQTVLINGNGVSITPQTSVLPAGYGQLSYIEGTGQQWTQLDYVATHDSRVVVDCISYETTSTDRALFGCREGTGGRPQFILWAGQKTTGYVTASFVYGSNVWDDDYDTGVAVGERFTVDASYNGVYINGDLFESITDQGNMPAYKVALFTVANGDGTYITDKGMGKYRIYSFKIYEGNDLVVDLVPALSASTGVGLYDVVNDKFYTSLTATPFAYDSSSVVYPSSYQIATKIGSGLQYDSNGAIEAIPAGLTPATSSTLGGVIVGNGLTVTSDGTISTATGKAYIAGEGINMSSSAYEFSAENEQYLFKSQVTCELHGDFNREFQKYTDNTALGMVWNVYNSGTLWSGPLFVGLSADAVKYTTNSTTYSALGTFSYLGKTWYYSDTQMYVSNIDGTDYDGNMVVDTETYASTSDIVQACKSLIDRARVILKVDEISLLPATEDTLGGIKIGEGLTIDENNVVSSTVYEEGQGITFETSGSTDSFDVKNKQYYFEDEAKCEITGNFGPRAYWRVYTDDPCLAVIFYRSDNTTAPLYIGLTANSVKMYQTWDGNVLGPTGTFAYKGYSWYYSYEYGLYYSSGVDQLGHLQTISGTSSDDLEDIAKHVIDLAELISPGIKTYDVWNTGTGWLNGAYDNSQSDYFWTNWYYTYHSKPDEYLEVPDGATKMRLIGISNENDSRLQGGGVDCFNSSHHHFASVGCITDEWADIPEGTVYLQFGVKWNELNDRTISSSDIKSVTLEIKVPKNNAITAKLGDGLTFDENDAITLDESIKLIIHCVGSPIS